MGLGATFTMVVQLDASPTAHVDATSLFINFDKDVLRVVGDAAGVAVDTPSGWFELAATRADNTTGEIDVSIGNVFGASIAAQTDIVTISFEAHGGASGGSPVTFSTAGDRTTNVGATVNQAVIDVTGTLNPATVTVTGGVNRAPVADAGPNQTVDLGDAVNLDGTGSSDPDGDQLTFTWTRISGPSVTLTDANTATPSFTPTVGGVYRFRLTVRDPGNLSGQSEVTITVNRPPTANAGPDQPTRKEGDTITLNGASSSDPDGDQLSFNWTQTGGPQVNLNVTGAATRTFLAADDGVYTFELEVSDGRLDSAPDEVVVTVANVDPTVDATVDPGAVDENGTVELDIDITDPGALDTFDVEIAWGDGTVEGPFLAPSRSFTRTHQYLDDNPTATPSDVNNVQVTVTDANDAGSSGTDSTNVTVNNVPPQINAIGENIFEGGTAELNVDIVDPGTQDTFTVEIDWDDGNPNEIFPLPAGTASFTRTHQYPDDDPSGTLSDIRNVSVTVTDDDTGSDTDTAPIGVQNVAPVVNAGPDQTVQSGSPAMLKASVIDPGILDNHTFIIDWGEPGSSQSQGTVIPNQFAAHLDGAQQPSPVDTRATGLGTFTLNLAGTQLTFDIPIELNLLTSSILFAHFHNGKLGENGGVVRTITDDLSGNSYTGTWSSTDPEPLTPELVEELRAGRLYINVHTVNHGGGEIRGQIGRAIMDSHIYASDGVYNVEVTVADDDLGQDSDTTSRIVGASVDLSLAPDRLDLGIGLQDLPNTGVLTLRAQANGTPVDDIHAVLNVDSRLNVANIDENPSSQSGVNVSCQTSPDGRTVTCDATGAIPTNGNFDIADITLQGGVIGPAPVGFDFAETTATSGGSTVLRDLSGALVKVNGLVDLDINVRLQAPAPGDSESFMVSIYPRDGLNPALAEMPWRIFDDSPPPVRSEELTVDADAPGGTSFTLSLTGLRTDVYDIVVGTMRPDGGLLDTLANLGDDVDIDREDLNVDMGTLLEGNAINEDGTEAAPVINALDASLMAAALNEVRFDARLDYNRDGAVDQADLDILKDNYYNFSPVVVIPGVTD